MKYIFFLIFVSVIAGWYYIDCDNSTGCKVPSGGYFLWRNFETANYCTECKNTTDIKGMIMSSHVYFIL